MMQPLSLNTTLGFLQSRLRSPTHTQSLLCSGNLTPEAEGKQERVDEELPHSGAAFSIS